MAIVHAGGNRFGMLAAIALGQLGTFTDATIHENRKLNVATGGLGFAWPRGSTGHAGHWQGHQGDKKRNRARAAKKVAHASRVRNRPKKAKKWSGRTPEKVRLRARKEARVRDLEARTYTQARFV